MVLLGDKSHFIVREKQYQLHVRTGDFSFEFDVNPIGHAEWCSNGCPHIDFTASVMDVDNHVWMTAEGRHQIGEESTKKSILKQTTHRVHTNTVGKTHGLLGQTVHNKEYPDHEADMRYIEGTLLDYVVHGNDIFGDKFKFNQYGVF